MTTTAVEMARVMSTCRCWQPIIAGVPGGPAWLHVATGRAGCEVGGLALAEPQSPVAPAVQGALFDLPPVRPGRRVGVLQARGQAADMPITCPTCGDPVRHTGHRWVHVADGSPICPPRIGGVR